MTKRNNEENDYLSVHWLLNKFVSQNNSTYLYILCKIEFSIVLENGMINLYIINVN